MDLPGRTGSIRLETPATTAYPPLEGDLQTDAAVIGGGITGVTTAMLLQEAGLAVTLVEADRLAGGTSGHTNAHLTSIPDSGLRRLVRSFGLERARRVVASAQAAMRRIAAWIEALRLPCEMRAVPGWLYTEREDHLPWLDGETEAARALGLPVERLPRAPLPFPTCGALRFPDEACFQPARYTRALAAAFVERGGRVLERSRVLEVADGAPCRVVTAAGTVTAGAVVLATHAPIGHHPALADRITPHRSYVIALRADGPPIPDGLFWDTFWPYHYLRNARDAEGGLLIVGGEDHPIARDKDPRRRFQRLERYARHRFAVGAVAYYFSSLVFESADALPYIGRVPGKRAVYTGTGYSGTGLAFGTLAGMLIADAILGRESPWAALYTPDRIPAAPRRGDPSGDGAPPRGADAADDGEAGDAIAAIPPGEGRVVQVNGSRLAVYRDAAGGLHALSPRCPKAGCLVEWNPSERSWDCPHHGERYSPKGRVLSGAPRADLEPRTLTA